MKSVSRSEWLKKAEGLAEWRKNRTSPPNLDLYKKIVSLVHIGDSVLDVGCGQCHLKKVLPDGVDYIGSDPFPIVEGVVECRAEDLIMSADTIFMLAALDNVQNVEDTLQSLRICAEENIVILTGIGIEPDKNHTHQIDRQDLVDVLGEPTLEVSISPRVYLFEWRL